MALTTIDTTIDTRDFGNQSPPLSISQSHCSFVPLATSLSSYINYTPRQERPKANQRKTHKINVQVD